MEKYIEKSLSISAAQIVRWHETDEHVIALVSYGIGGVKRHYLPLPSVDAAPVVAPSVPQAEAASLTEIPGLGAELSAILIRLGYTDAAAVCGKSDAELLALPGVGAGRLRALRKFCQGVQ